MDPWKNKNKPKGKYIYKKVQSPKQIFKAKNILQINPIKNGFKITNTTQTKKCKFNCDFCLQFD